jgi:hypothetical protein
MKKKSDMSPEALQREIARVVETFLVTAQGLEAGGPDFHIDLPQGDATYITHLIRLTALEPAATLQVAPAGIDAPMLMRLGVHLAQSNLLAEPTVRLNRRAVEVILACIRVMQEHSSWLTLPVAGNA